MAVDLAKKPMQIGILSKYNDLMVGIAALVVAGMIVVPMPEWALDILLTINIIMALTIVLVTIYSTKPLEFSSFPSMLLVTTLFRLALSIAVTRLILLDASAGSVVSAFGSVVVGGNYVVGLVVFIILVIVQFVVITNGTGRVSEVAARFTLDAMPGKQMAIDADLNAGLIDDNEARSRRKEIADEADFYGAMDGSSKFMRGDSIAAIVIIIVNILGGFIVGIVQKNMDFMTALQTYTLLTVGAGLVMQIPALLISTATGLMVTKTASDKDLGSDISQQILAQPKALMIVSGICAIIAFIPGIPKLPFMFGAVMSGILAYILNQQANVKTSSAEQEVAEAPKGPENMTDLLAVDAVEVELGYGLIPLADPKQGGDLLERITAVRRQAAIDLGMLVPAIRVRDNMSLKPNTYTVKLRGTEAASGEVYTGHLLAMDPGTAVSKIQGIETTEPAFGLPAIWISDIQQTEAEMAGYTVVDPPTVLITHLTETLRRHAAEILTRQDVQTLIDTVKEHSPAIVNELIPEQLTLGEVQKVLQNLLAERVSIKDMPTILEALGDAVRLTRDIDILTEYVRQALCRQITAQYQCPDGVIRAFTIDPSLEQIIADNVRQVDTGCQLVMEPMLARQILEATKAQVEAMAEMGYQPVALCSPRTRIHYKRLVERMVPTLAAISFNELAGSAGLETIGIVSINNENVENNSRQCA